MAGTVALRMLHWLVGCVALALVHSAPVRNDPRQYGLRHGKLYKPVLTYKVAVYPDHLKHQAISESELKKYVDESLDRAILTWSSAVPMEFKRGEDEIADIMVSFFSGDHGDGFPFDGRDMTTNENAQSHVFFPKTERKGQIHLDDDEPWEDMRLDLSMAHAVGHALGIAGQQRTDSIMNELYRSIFEDKPVELTAYDVFLVKKLYLEELAEKNSGQ